MQILKTILSLLLKYSLTVIALVVSFAIGAALSIGAETNDTTASNDATFLIVALLNALVFSYWLYHTKRKGWHLLGYFFLVYFGVNTVMPQIETWFFGNAVGFEGIQKWGIVQMGLINALLFAPLALLIWGKFKKRTLSTPFNWQIFINKWIGLTCLYVLVYFLFGYYVAWQSSAVREFYTGNQTLLPFGAHFRDLVNTNFWIFPFQILRGVGWVGLGYIIVRVLDKNKWENAMMVALIFSMPATFLFLPNPYMPEAVRMAHFVETLSANFLYGGIVGWVLSDL